MSDILIEKDGAVLSVEFNRPERKNAITVAMYQALADTLSAAGADSAVRVMLFRGQAGMYTSGNDLADFLSNPPRDENAPVLQFLRALSRFEKPLVAAVAGAAVGIGTTMLLHCDLVYAAPGTRFVLPFVNLGVVPELASSYLLPRMAGYQQAAELFLLGDPIDAQRAQQIGFVNEIVPAEKLFAHAAAVAARLAAKPPAALRLTRALLKRSLAEPTADAIEAEWRIFGERLQSPEAKEAFAAFFEKRKPDFSKFE